uniref:Growth arrest and DNA damage inducible beta n=1 Tax=Cyclopterus lumpus TaxID=8103 RepID=A0A8C2X5T9_CYCLU
MTLEEFIGSNSTEKRMETVTQALEELLVAAQNQDSLTVGVYESAKLMNVDPDSVVLCVLAADEEDQDDVALQIHFTLLQAFCCDNDIDILRVSGVGRLAQLLDQDPEDEPRDLHCILVTRVNDVPGRTGPIRDLNGPGRTGPIRTHPGPKQTGPNRTHPGPKQTGPNRTHPGPKRTGPNRTHPDPSGT